MVKVNLTNQALADIENIAKFIASNSLTYAKIQVQRFFDRIEVFETNPQIGRVVPEINDKSIRELITGNYRIIYKLVNEKQIDIVTIHSSFMLLSNAPTFKK